MYIFLILSSIFLGMGSLNPGLELRVSLAIKARTVNPWYWNPLPPAAPAPSAAPLAELAMGDLVISSDDEEVPPDL